jgi:hypothetical protein
MDETNTQTLEHQFPSAELAYPLAVSSYETAQKRLEAVEKRLQEILAFAVTINFAVITIFAGKNFDFNSKWFIAAMIIAFAGLAVGVYTRLGSHLILIKPSVLYNKYITDNQIEFKRSFIYFAGEHWDKNVRLINHKGTLSNITVILFTVEIILLAVWAVAAASVAVRP